MCQTLLYIPYKLGPVWLFGPGVLLGLWLAFSVVWLTLLVRRYGWRGETFGQLPTLAIVVTRIGR